MDPNTQGQEWFEMKLGMWTGTTKDKVWYSLIRLMKLRTKLIGTDLQLLRLYTKLNLKQLLFLFNVSFLSVNNLQIIDI